MKKILVFIILIFGVFLIFSCCGTGNPKRSQKKALPAPSISLTQTQGTGKKNAPLRFAVMADCRGLDEGINKKIIERTLQCIKKILPQPQFAVIPGDLIEGASYHSDIKSQLQHFKNTVTKYYPPEFFYPGFGNHEATAGMDGEAAFGEVFPEINADFLEGYNHTVYYFDKYNTRFYMLNSNHPGEGHTISDTQLNWIKANTDPGKRHNLYFFHEPAYPTGSHAGSSLDANKLQRDRLWEVIDRSAQPMVFCGHEHNYTRRHINSDFNETIDGQAFKFVKKVYQVTTGTFGAPTYMSYTEKKDVDVPPIPEYHFAIVDINKDKIEVTVYKLDGEVIDHFSQ